MYSIIQTCIQNDINPRAYLKFYFEKSISGEGRMSSETIKAMLPGNLNKSIVEKFDLSLK